MPMEPVLQQELADDVTIIGVVIPAAMIAARRC